MRVAPGVDGVLDQLLDDGRRALDDLAGGDLVGEVGREPADAAHGGYSQRLRRKNASISTPDAVAMMPRIHQNCDVLAAGEVRQRHVHAVHARSAPSAA